jgi:hypothetical protein
MKNSKTSNIRLLLVFLVITALGLTGSYEAKAQCYAGSVVSFSQGLRKDKTSVDPGRSDANAALGEPERDDSQGSFVALGFQGELVLKFDNPIANCSGADLAIWETTFGGPACAKYPETAEIWVSQDGVNFDSLGTVCLDGSLDLSDVGLDWIQYVKIKDSSDPNAFKSGISDGYDVDGIECLNGEYTPISYASSVEEFNQGLRKDGGAVLFDRSDSSQALGEPDRVNSAALNSGRRQYVSLGFGGDIVLKFPEKFYNGPGDDLKLYETSYGQPSCSKYPEKADVFASVDGSDCSWVYLGEACQDQSFDLGGLSCAQYVKVVDKSDASKFSNSKTTDAFDVDGVEAYHHNDCQDLTCDNNLVNGYASEVVDFQQALRKNGTPVPANRSDSSQALGAPDNLDYLNFVSLGFGGSITLKLDYVLFDLPGDDLEIIETSYGTSWGMCNQYPEKAVILLSKDNVNWVELDTICRDADVDINGRIDWALYVKIVDVSPNGKFGADGDGFDVDGIINLHCAAGISHKASNTSSITPERVSLNVYPNPFVNDLNVNYRPIESDEVVSVKIYNIMGQPVYTHTFNRGSDVTVEKQLALKDLTSGVYFLTVQSESHSETVKLIKE